MRQLMPKPEHCAMPNAEQCRTKAAECEQIAARMPDNEFRQLYLYLARQWRTVADYEGTSG